MNYYILIVVFLIFLIFLIMFIRKLSNPKWFEQFMTDTLEDKDIFTRFLKFLITKK